MEDLNEINIKQCGYCKEHKDFKSFNKCKAGKFGLHGHCRQCAKKHKDIWNENNKQWIKDYPKQQYVKENARKIHHNRYYSDIGYREKILEKNRIRRRLEPAKIKQRLNEKFRRKTNINYKLACCLRSRIRIELNKIKFNLNVEVNKCANTIELLGCSIFDLKIYLENLFLPGMSWENHGFGDNCWHIDHIKPCAAFDLSKPEEQRGCFHYKNLQPLWQKDNLSKNDKYIEPDIIKSIRPI